VCEKNTGQIPEKVAQDNDFSQKINNIFKFLARFFSVRICTLSTASKKRKIDATLEIKNLAFFFTVENLPLSQRHLKYRVFRGLFWRKK